MESKRACERPNMERRSTAAGAGGERREVPRMTVLAPAAEIGEWESKLI